MTERVASHAVVDVDGLPFNVIDDHGVMWVMETIKGWHDGPSVSVTQTPRLTSHGTFRAPGRRGGRTIILSGSLHGNVRALVGGAVDQLAALLADGGYGRFTFEDDDQGARWADVQLADVPDIDWVSDELVLFQIQLFAPDSYRYAATSSASATFAVPHPEGVGMAFPMFTPDGVQTFGDAPLVDGGSASVRNAGTAPTWPTFTITGPTPQQGFVITDAATGRRITYYGVVNEGNTLTIDARRGSVLLDGADRAYAAVIEAWPTVPRESTRDYLFESLGDHTAAILTAEVTSAYW